MIFLNTHKICTILDVQLIEENVEIKGISIDTRTLQSGNLFIALLGSQSDGHDYILDAKNAGAAAILVSNRVEIDIPQIVVSDTTVAMGQLAKYWREQFDIPFIGVTGSCGKTTTTRMISAILEQIGPCLVPQANYNNQWGVPLTLFNLDHKYRFAVIEMGADRPGEIKSLAAIVQPDVAVITNVAAVHLEVMEGIGFGNIDGVFNEKSEIYSALAQEGVAIVCADDNYYSQWCRQLVNQAILSFGFCKQADVRAENLHSDENMQYSFNLLSPQGEERVQLSSIGKHNVINALAASAVALSLGATLSDIKRGLAAVPAVAHRMIRLSAKKAAILIDDSYNSNLKSAQAVLDMLAEYPGRKIAVLGDMLEIGADSATHHQLVGAHAKDVGVDYLFAYGPESIAMAQAFGDNASHYMDVKPLVNAVIDLLDTNTMIIVKGSLGIGMLRIVKQLVD